MNGIPQVMNEKPIQDYYPDEVAICYGCGRNNPKGLRIETRWDGEEGICRFTPEPHHTAFPGFVYGGLVASLINCHSMGTAIAAAYRADGRDPGTAPGDHLRHRKPECQVPPADSGESRARLALAGDGNAREEGHRRDVRVRRREWIRGGRGRGRARALADDAAVASAGARLQTAFLRIAGRGAPSPI